MKRFWKSKIVRAVPDTTARRPHLMGINVPVKNIVGWIVCVCAIALVGQAFFQPRLSAAPGDLDLTFGDEGTGKGITDWSYVGDSGNAPDIQTGAYGAVAQGYYIGTYEVTNAQYAEFLNAVDPIGVNPHGLYNSNMATAPSGGIAFNSSAVDGAKYEVRANMGNKPVTFVSMLDAQRFANWMHNGQGNASTESGAYEVGALAVHDPNALFWIPTGNEWYKAAYYDPTLNDGAGGYWMYPTRSNTGPDTAFATPIGDISNPGPNIANYNYRANWNGSGWGGNVTTVGSAGPFSTSHYGTYDQAGNVYEWTEEIAGSNRRAFGGSYEASGNPPWFPLGSERQYWAGWAEPSTDYASVGFRLACAAPVDTTPPTIVSLSASPDTLWPPNNKLVPIQVEVVAVDDSEVEPICGIADVTCNETMNEENVVLSDSLSLSLMATRLGKGEGRVYTITVMAMDLSGNSSEGTVTVTIPHDQGKKNQGKKK